MRRKRWEELNDYERELRLEKLQKIRSALFFFGLPVVLAILMAFSLASLCTFHCDQRQFTNAPFRLDIAKTSYVVSLLEQEAEEPTEYSIKVENTKFAVLGEGVSCTGILRTDYNAYGRVIYKGVAVFYINKN